MPKMRISGRSANEIVHLEDRHEHCKNDAHDEHAHRDDEQGSEQPDQSGNGPSYDNGGNDQGQFGQQEPPQAPPMVGAAPSLMQVYTVTVQQELGRRGYYRGPVDGMPGAQTQDLEVTLLYFDGCPHWRTADANLRDALAHPSLTGTRLRYQRVETVEEAERLGFTGSPTILIDGVDQFGEPGAAVGLACRVYATPKGLAGAPTPEQLEAALQAARSR